MKKFKRIRKLKDYRIHREGTEILLVALFLFLLVNVPLWYFCSSMIVLNSLVSFASFVLYLLMVNFFRSPKRIFPGEVDDVIVAPADGKVVVIEKVFEPDYFKDERMQISIFMSPTNVHANWYPVDGVVTCVRHQKGCQRPAPRTSVLLWLSRWRPAGKFLYVRLPELWQDVLSHMLRPVRSASLTSIWALSSSAHVSICICLLMWI